MISEIGEYVSLVIATVGYIIIIIEFTRYRNLLHIFVSYTLLFIGMIATVMEEFYFHEIFNITEHVVGIALAGLAFAATAYLSNVRINEIKKSIKK
jgi:hypothetical protein